MKNLNIEFRPLTDDDFSEAPKCFEKEFADARTVLIRHDNCGMLFPKDDNPHYYFHNMNVDTSRWAGFVRLGTGPLSVQTSAHHLDIAQSAPITRYGPVSTNPLLFGVKSTAGINMEFTYNASGCAWKEGDDGSILDVHGEWFPNGAIFHMGSEYNIPFIHIPVLLTGTYQGESIQFLACIDRVFAPAGREEEILANATTYVSTWCSGIRKDGRREWICCLIRGNNGTGLGIYWLEGEEPIISTEIRLDSEWERLPYVDDDTVVCKDQTWKFGGKEFHIKGKWGSKGFSAEPRLDRHGQSQVFGTWYAGSEPYEHQLWNTFTENMEVYADAMKERGFNVKD